MRMTTRQAQRVIHRQLYEYADWIDAANVWAAFNGHKAALWERREICLLHAQWQSEAQSQREAAEMMWGIGWEHRVAAGRGLW